MFLKPTRPSRKSLWRILFFLTAKATLSYAETPSADSPDVEQIRSILRNCIDSCEQRAFSKSQDPLQSILYLLGSRKDHDLWLHGISALPYFVEAQPDENLIASLFEFSISDGSFACTGYFQYRWSSVPCVRADSIDPKNLRLPNTWVRAKLQAALMIGVLLDKDSRIETKCAKNRVVCSSHAVLSKVLEQLHERDHLVKSVKWSAARLFQESGSRDTYVKNTATAVLAKIKNGHGEGKASPRNSEATKLEAKLKNQATH